MVVVLAHTITGFKGRIFFKRAEVVSSVVCYTQGIMLSASLVWYSSLVKIVQTETDTKRSPCSYVEGARVAVCPFRAILIRDNEVRYPWGLLPLRADHKFTPSRIVVQTVHLTRGLSVVIKWLGRSLPKLFPRSQCADPRHRDHTFRTTDGCWPVPVTSNIGACVQSFAERRVIVDRIHRIPLAEAHYLVLYLVG